MPWYASVFRKHCLHAVSLHTKCLAQHWLCCLSADSWWQVESYKDILDAQKLLFPGVGSYGQAMGALQDRGLVDALKEFLQVLHLRVAVPNPQQQRNQHAPCCCTWRCAVPRWRHATCPHSRVFGHASATRSCSHLQALQQRSLIRCNPCSATAASGTCRKPAVEPTARVMQTNRPFFGICLGLQLLYDGGDENGGVEGLGIIPGRVGEFDRAAGLPVPHIGWSTLAQARPSRLLSTTAPHDRVYFVHSYRAVPEAGAAQEWVLATAQYGEEFVAAVNKGNVHACQFHPEKSGQVGQALLRNFLDYEQLQAPDEVAQPSPGAPALLRVALVCAATAQDIRLLRSSEVVCVM